jgi:hypothetical protein
MGLSDGEVSLGARISARVESVPADLWHSVLSDGDGR